MSVATGARRRADLLLRGGTVIDGSGTPGQEADLAVTGGVIDAIGDLTALAADQEVDVRGCVVCPGFIDSHTHDDRVLIDSPLHVAKLSQGVTTVVTGNCGLSLAPLRFGAAPGRPRRPPPPLDLLGGAEAFAFDSFAGWMETLDTARPALNVAPLVGHATLRVACMEDLGRPATDGEIARMRELFGEALAAGAFGLSSGLYYPPAAAAPATEVAALVELLAPAGGVYTAHIRDEGAHVLEAMEEACDIAARAGGVPLVLSHHKVAGRANFGRSRETLALLEARRRAQPVAADVYPYAASSTVLEPDHLEQGSRVLVTWSDAHPAAAGRDLADIAAEWGVDEREAARRLLPAGAIYFRMDEDDVRRILAHPDVMIGSDGLPADRHPHPRLWGTFPRVLGHYARDLGLFTLAQAVHRMTGLTAARFGIAGRGLLRQGGCADIVVFDPARVADRASFEHPATPASGIEMVIVNGVVAWRDGGATGARAGQALRRSAPACGAPG